jgi:hypothetical protein
MWQRVDAPSECVYLHPDDLAGKLTPTRGVPNRLWTPDEIAILHLVTGRLRVDPDRGVVVRDDGYRAEHPTATGYGSVYLGRVDGKQRFARAHRVVWIAARGRIPGMYEINHRNGLRWDNRIGNLDLVTHADNIRHGHRLPYEHVPGVPFLGEDDRPAAQPFVTGSIVDGRNQRRSRCA